MQNSHRPAGEEGKLVWGSSDFSVGVSEESLLKRLRSCTLCWNSQLLSLSQFLNARLSLAAYGVGLSRHCFITWVMTDSSVVICTANICVSGSPVHEQYPQSSATGEQCRSLAFSCSASATSSPANSPALPEVNKQD